jgi:Arc/MetJ family transcription regulator
MKKEYDFSKGIRGPVVPLPPGKTRITIRIDDDLLDWFRDQVDAAGGGNYQTMMNQALREYVNREKESVETTVRRVVREEFARYVTGRPAKSGKRRARAKK